MDGVKASNLMYVISTITYRSYSVNTEYGHEHGHICSTQPFSKNICITSNRVQNRYDGIGRVALFPIPCCSIAKITQKHLYWFWKVHTNQWDAVSLMKGEIFQFPTVFCYYRHFCIVFIFLPHIHTRFCSFRLKAMLLFLQHTATAYFRDFRLCSFFPLRTFIQFCCTKFSAVFVWISSVRLFCTRFCSECVPSAECCAVLASLFNRIGLTIKI